MDLIICLRNNSQGVNGLKEKEIKPKIDSLNVELLKIDNELFELEKKYGEFKINTSQYMQDKSDLESNNKL